MKLCFVIAPIGPVDSGVRRRSNGILDEVIRPAFEPLGYVVERADHDASPGIIPEAIIAKLLSAELVVAELTGHNANVMYELAVRHAFGKPVIMMLEEGHELPFDIRAQNTVFYSGDLAGRAESIIKLKRAHDRLGEPLANGNPVRRTIDVMKLQAEATDKETLLFDLLVQLRRDVAAIRERVGPTSTEPIPPRTVSDPAEDEPWSRTDLASLAPEQKAAFVRDKLFPAVRNRAYREWENLAYANMDGKVQERTLELGEEHARALGILDAWYAFRRGHGKAP